MQSSGLSSRGSRIPTPPSADPARDEATNMEPTKKFSGRSPATLPAFETVVPRDINSTKKHDDVVPQECKPSSPTPARELEPVGKTLQLSIGGGCIRFSNGKAGAVAAHELEKE
jgi:hypothetical protein